MQFPLCSNAKANVRGWGWVAQLNRSQPSDSGDNETETFFPSRFSPWQSPSAEHRATMTSQKLFEWWSLDIDYVGMFSFAVREQPFSAQEKFFSFAHHRRESFKWKFSSVGVVVSRQWEWLLSSYESLFTGKLLSRIHRIAMHITIKLRAGRSRSYSGKSRIIFLWAIFTLHIYKWCTESSQLSENCLP